METYRGCIETTDDALLIFEACRLGMLQRVSRRLVEDERNCIQSGSVYVWDESESGIRRWTDGKRWSPSRVNGCFLIYTELEPKTSTSSPSSRPGLVKKALSLFTAHASKLHLVCYYNKEDLNSGKLMTPSQDPLLCKLPIPRSLYPDVIPELIHVASSHSISGYPAHGNSSHGRSSAFSSYPVVQSSSVSSAQRCSGQSRTSGLSSVAAIPEYLRNQYLPMHQQPQAQYLATHCASPQSHPTRYAYHADPVTYDTRHSPVFQPHYMVSVPAGTPSSSKIKNHQTLAISKYDPMSMPQGPRSAPLPRTENKQEYSATQQQRRQPVRPGSGLQYSAGSESGVINHRSMSQPVPPRSGNQYSAEASPLVMVPCQRSSTTGSTASTSSPSSSSSSGSGVRLPPISDLFKAVEQISKRQPANVSSSTSVELSGARGRYMGEPWGRTSGLRSTIRGPGGYLSRNNDMTGRK